MMDADPPPTGNLAWQLILLLVLILCNAFFSASEIAIISLNDNKIRKMAEDGHKKARKVLKLTENSSRFLATIQIGVTLAGFFTSAFAAQSLAEPLSDWLKNTFPALQAYADATYSVSTVVITLVMSYFTLVLGELVPKRIAMQKEEPIAFAVVGILRVIAAVTAPFVKFLSVSTDLIVRLFGMDPHADEEKVTEEEIRMMVDVGEEKGVIEGSQKEMINNIFEFDDITAEDIMTPRTDLSALDVEDPIIEALRMAVDEGYSRLPVYEEDIDHIIGILYIKDLLPYVGQTVPAEVSIRHLMREAYFVPGTKRCGELFTELTEKHTQMAVVVDEYGGVAGIVTMEDLLESIVGNIQDEFDHEEEEVTQTGENTFEVDGSIDMDELTDLLGTDLPEGDYDTLAGFILNELGRLPADGEQPEVTYENLTFKVLQMEERRIERVYIQRQPVVEEPEDEESSSKKNKE